MTEFLRPQFVGERFERGSIPLEMLSDLSALREIIVEVAKWRYLQANPDRARSPKGFTNGVTFGITRVEKGSAIPVIDMEVITSGTPDSPQFPGLPGKHEQYFNEARDLIVEAIAAAEGNTGVEELLPSKCLGMFDRIGRRLRDDESINFNTPDGTKKGRLTKESRRRLIRASQVNEITEDISIRGLIPEADQDRMTFQVQLRTGHKIHAVMNEQNRETVLEVFNGYDDHGLAWIRGIGKHDWQGLLIRIDAVDEIIALDPLDVPSRLDEFRELKDGWFEGEGRAFHSEALDWLASQFDERYPADLPLPHLYPTPEGGVRAEWSKGASVAILETNLVDHSASWLWFDRDSDADHEHQLNLDDDKDWSWWVDELRNRQNESA